jgi:flavin reductase (DIM6/NTAB) family NADH-FMN oxidoreductase RutF/DNA-binding MarR family transcriptional regulator
MTTALVHSGDPREDSRGFRQCLGQFSTGVTVVTAEHGGARVGVTANSFSSLSLDPPLILWSINRTSRAFAVFSEAAHFAVNILAEDQVQVSQRFASKEDDKFATVDWYPGHDGAPLIRGAAARIECTTETLHEGGDHLLIVGRVTRFEREERRSLIFSQGRYSIGLDHPVLRPDAATTEAKSVPADATLGALVFKAHLVSSRSFDAGRAALGLSIGEGRVLYVLSEHDALPLDALVKFSNLPAQTIEDALADLAEKGAVERRADGTIGLTAQGRNLRAVVRERSLAREAEMLRNIAPDHLAIAKDVLARFIAQPQAASEPLRSAAG